MNDAILHQLAYIAVGAAALMLVLWAFQVVKKDAGVVDVGWAFGLGVAAIYAGLSGEGEPARRVLVAAIGGAWGLRLAWHLLTDRVIGAKEEDGRYKDLRAKLGQRTNVFHLFFFQAQGVLVAALSIPFLFAASDAGPFPRPTDIAAALLWIIGLVGESIADRQLKAFKARPESRGKTCRAGLWHYSRHPNYFFEWLMWCAYALAAAGAENGAWAALAPAFMLLLIVKVTGIPPTEARALRSRGDDYREYQRTTSAFVPWFPKKLGAVIDAD